MRPSCLRTTIVWLMFSPSPVPLPGGLVVKKGRATGDPVSASLVPHGILTPSTSSAVLTVTVRARRARRANASARFAKLLDQAPR
jgi:hypothetical protein